MRTLPGTESTPQRWFRQRGLIALLRDTGEETGARVRGAPALVAIFLVVMLWAVPEALDVPWAVGVLVSIATIVATWVLANLVRRRPPLAPVAKIGGVEALAFVGVPTLVVLLTPRGPYRSDGIDLSAEEARILLPGMVLVLQLLLLAAVFILLTSGIGALLSLLARELIGALSRTSGALAAVIPIMLGFVFFFFLNTGVWSAIAGLDGWSFAGLVGFLLCLGGLFLGSRQQFSLAELTRFDSTDEVRDALRTTPFPDLAHGVRTPATCPIDARQAFNLRAVSVLSRLVTALVLASAVFVIFLVLGFIVVGPDLVQAWTKTPPATIVSVSFGGHTHIVCWQQLKVAGFLATFSAFNYTLVAATDSRLRQDATDAATVIVRQACALRLALLQRRDLSQPTS